MPKKRELEIALKQVENLKSEIKQLKSRKRYGLVWETKDEDIVLQCKEELPVLIEENNKEIKTDKSKPTNIFIEGDNYHALSVLNYTHQGKIDLVYIDPPYNTGARDWKYNNHFVDSLDTYRHSKWIAMMNSRIRLAKKLLQNTGIFICAVDHYELFNLGLLCDEIFGEENRLGIITVVHKPEGRNQEKFFGTSNEFMFVYAKNINKAKFNKIVLDSDLQSRYDKEDENGKYRLKNFIRLTDGKYSLRRNKPHFFYPIYVSGDLKKFSISKNVGYNEVFPITDKGVERTWKTTKETFIKLANAGSIIAKKEGGKIVLYEKLREDQVIKTHWIDKKYHGYHYGTKILEDILGKKLFDFPKSLYLLIDILKITTNRESIILDFFAGSGTTGQATLELNKIDDGHRQVILCTNNENKIAEDVCYPRIKKVIKGYPSNKGLGGNLKYYKTDFVDAKNTDSNKKKLVDKSTEMLCLKENCFEDIKNSRNFKIFKNNKDKYLGIVYDDAGIVPFKREAQKINKKFIVYVFSLDDSAREEEFNDIKNLVELKPIPAVILNVYKRIFK